MTIEQIALHAAKQGRVLYELRADTRDALEVLAEMGGSATVPQMQSHLGTTNTSWLHGRMTGLERKGLVRRRGQGTSGRPFRFALTKAGRWLLEQT